MTFAFRRVIRSIGPLVPFVVAAAVVLLKLPDGTRYAGTDPGFSLTEPFSHIVTQTWFAWSWYGTGSVNFYNYLVIPFYILFSPLNAFLSPQIVSRCAEILEYGALGVGAYALSMQLIDRGRNSDVLRSLFVALFAMFGTFGALLLLVPASEFQPAFALWPLLLAWELRLLRDRRSILEIAAFALLFYAALSGNLAHSAVGTALCVLVAVADASSKRSFGSVMRIAAVVVTIVLLMLTPLWLPLVAYKLAGGSPILFNSNLARPEDLTNHAAISASYSSFANLLQLNTVIWWRDLEQAKTIAQQPAALIAFALAALAVIGICNGRFSASTRRFWGILWLASLFLAKGMHAPFGSYYAHFLTLPLAAMFREANDKFLLGFYVATIALAAIGTARFERPLAACAGFAALVLAAYPFFAGEPLLGAFDVRVPADYGSVASILGRDPQARVLSFAPSNFNEQGSTTWYHGSNLDEALLVNPITYTYAFQALGLSETPVFNDDSLRAAQEYFADVQTARILGIRYVLVHKDFTQRFNIGLSSNDSRVAGATIAAGLLAQCNADAELERLFDGQYLALYRLRKPEPPLVAFDGLHAVRGYSNALFSLLESAPGARGFALSGAQFNDAVTSLPAPAFLDAVRAFTTPPTAGITTDQQLSAPPLEASIAASYDALRLRGTTVAAMPPGDLVTGVRARSNWGVKVPLAAGVYPVSAFYRHRGGYFVWERGGIALTPGAQVAKGAAIGATEAAPVLQSPTAASAAVYPNLPLEGDLHAFVALDGDQELVGGAHTVDLTLASPSGTVDVYANVNLADLGQAVGSNQIADLVSYAGSDRPLSLDIDIPGALAALAAKDERSADLLQPGLRIVRAAIVVNRQSDELDRPIRLVTFRFYNAVPDDYSAELLATGGVAPNFVVSSDAILSTARDAEGTRVARVMLDKARDLEATYSFPAWHPGTLVLAADSYTERGGTYSAVVRYRLGGKRYVADGVTVATDHETRPWGAPYDLSFVHGAGPQTLDWLRVSVDLRSVLPDLARARVDGVTLKFAMADSEPGLATFAFGPMVGFLNAAPAYPLAPMRIDARTLLPVRVTKEGKNASVAFAPLHSAGVPVVFSTRPESANEPHAVRVGPPVAASTVTARGQILNPTLGVVEIGAPQIVELGTDFNRGWVLRRGLPPAELGPFPALRAWLSTSAASPPHFVTDGFANAWYVTPGSYTVVFMPQAVREASIFIMAAGLALAMVAYGGIALFRRVAVR